MSTTTSGASPSSCDGQTPITLFPGSHLARPICFVRGSWADSELVLELRLSNPQRAARFGVVLWFVLTLRLML